jgi:hypothetical protein
MSSGTTAGLQCMTPHTWDMLGKGFRLFSSQVIRRITRNYVTQDVLRRIMTDYFGYDVHFVMNVTDIDDKVHILTLHLPAATNYYKIIQRARQNHLLDTFRSETKVLSSDLIAQVQSSWRAHVRERVGKGLLEDQRPVEGEEEQAWPRLVELIQDKAWKQECLKRDEKFDMYFSSAVRWCEIIVKLYAKILAYVYRCALWPLFKSQKLIWRVEALVQMWPIN